MKKFMVSIIVAAVAAFSFASGPTILDSVKMDIAGTATLPSRAVLLQTTPPDSGQWSITGFFDVKAKHLDMVAINKLRDLTIKGKLTGFELDAFAGTTADKDGKAVAGVGIGYTRQIWDQVVFQAGAGPVIESGVPVSFGVWLGIGYKF